MICMAKDYGPPDSPALTLVNPQVDVYPEVAATGSAPPRPGGLCAPCPPASACGGCLLLYLRAKASRPRRGSAPRLSGARRPGPTAYFKAAGGGALWWEVKEEVAAAGRRRGTWTPKGTPTRRSGVVSAPRFVGNRRPANPLLWESPISSHRSVRMCPVSKFEMEQWLVDKA